MRKIQFVNNHFYHVFNRGVDKREIFTDKEDLLRFFQCMDEFNVVEPIGSLYANSFKLSGSAAKSAIGSKKLVNFVAYCLNPNHYHFILEQLVDRGIEKFMHRLGGGHTWYFNYKNKRSGSLFQGRYKAIHVDSNEYLLHLGIYVNLNDKVHQLSGSAAKLTKSSWDEYLKGDKDGFCRKDIILGQFNNVLEYKNFAESSLGDIQERKELKKLILE